MTAITVIKMLKQDVVVERIWEGSIFLKNSQERLFLPNARMNFDLSDNMDPYTQTSREFSWKKPWVCMSLVCFRGRKGGVIGMLRQETRGPMTGNSRAIVSESDFILS